MDKVVLGMWLSGKALEQMDWSLDSTCYKNRVKEEDIRGRVERGQKEKKREEGTGRKGERKDRKAKCLLREIDSKWRKKKTTETDSSGNEKWSNLAQAHMQIDNRKDWWLHNQEASGIQHEVCILLVKDL